MATEPRYPQRPNTTDYEHPQERHLLDLHYAMQYRSDGSPELRVNSAIEGNVIIEGNVNIPGSVEISNDIGNPVPISRNTTVNSSTNPLYISGNVAAISPSEPTAITAFGEPLAIQLTPVIQIDGIYGLDPNKFDTISQLGGATDTDGPYMECSTGTAQYGYGVIRSKRSVRYRPGQGASTRFTAAFTTDEAGLGYTGYTQRAGFFNQEQALMVGFDGTQFGVLRQNGGKASIWRLTVLTPASGGGSIVTIVLNGVTFTISVSAGTVAENVRQIKDAIYAGWIVEGASNRVNYLSRSVGPLAGAFSVSATGTFTAIFEQVQVGVAHTDTWTYQADFNIDKLNGTGPSGVTIDPSKLNIYQINFRWLGAGEIRFAVENPINGDFIFFHHVHYSNRYRVPHLDNPSLKIGYVAASLGGTGTNVVVRGVSAMGAIEGIIAPTTYPDSASSTRSGGLNSGGTYYHMLSLQNRLVLNSKINTREIILKSISAGCTSAASAPVRIVMYRNATTVDARTWVFVDETWSSALYSDTTTTFDPTLYVPIFQFLISPGAAEIVSLEDYRIIISPSESVSIAIVGSGVISQADIVLNWVED